MAVFRSVGLGLIGAAVLLTTIGCKKPPPQAEVIRPVRAVRLNDIEAFHSGYLPGRAKATQEVDLAFRISGPLTRFRVDIGSKVAEGDVVAEIDPTQFQYEVDRTNADLKAATAELTAMKAGARQEEVERLIAARNKAEAKKRTATNEFQRAEPLLASRTISKSDYDRYLEAKQLAEAEFTEAEKELAIAETTRKEDLDAKQGQVDALKAANELAQADLSYTKLKAPFAGTVVAKYVENYENVQAKEPIVRIVDTSRIEIIVNVPEGSISLVPHVTDITCEFDALPGKPLPATVKEVGTEATRSTRTYPVTLIMDQPEGMEILPGMTGRVTGKVQLDTGSGEVAIEVPETAVFEGDDQQSHVWVIETSDGKTGTAQLRDVSVGKLTSRGLQITSGLKSQEIVATAGVYQIEEGQKVRIQLTAYEVAAK